MVTLETLYNDIKTLKQSFYDKTEIDENYPYYEYIIGTQTSSTGAWTGNSSKIKSLSEGTVIYYKLPYAGNGNATLNLTLADGTSTTGAKDVYFNNTTRLTTHFGVGAVIGLIYDGSVWRVLDPYTNSNTYDRNVYGYQIVAGEALARGVMIYGYEGKYYKIASGKSLDIRYPILYCDANLAKDGNTASVYNILNGINLNNTKSGLSFTHNKTVYLEGTLSKGIFTISNNVFVSEDHLANGNYYIPLGASYSASQIRFNSFEAKIVYKYSSTHGLVPVGYSYNDLLDKPTIPTNTNQLTNGAGFLTSVPAHTNADATKVGKATSSVFGHTKLSSAVNSTDESIAATPKAVKTAYDLGDKLTKRYNGVFVSGVETATKPFLRLFNILAGNHSFSSSHLIFEIIGNNNDRQYAKIRVDMRQNDNSQASNYTVTPLEVYGIDLSVLYFGFRNNYPYTSIDIFRKVGSWTNFYVRIYDDHIRNGTYTQFSPVANGTESYTTLEEASTALYNASYTSTSQGSTYPEVNNSLPYTNLGANKFVKRGGTSAQFLKADGSVDSNSYSKTNHNHDSTYLKQTGFSTQEMVITYDDDTTETVKFVTYTSGGSL